MNAYRGFSSVSGNGLVQMQEGKFPKTERMSDWSLLPRNAVARAVAADPHEDCFDVVLVAELERGSSSGVDWLVSDEEGGKLAYRLIVFSPARGSQSLRQRALDGALERSGVSVHRPAV